MSRDRWLQLMELWRFGANDKTLESLLAAYSGKGRHYHSQEHVNACLRHLDRCIGQVEAPGEVELALWFHDAVYKPLAGDNERQSAEWAAAFLADNGAPRESIARVHRLIMVTEHNAPTQSADESILVDIDLSILGAEPQVYAEFERNVRREYKRVPLFLYKKKRAEILQGFLDRAVIFRNEPFATERESQARQNLTNAIAQLTGNDKR